MKKIIVPLGSVLGGYVKTPSMNGLDYHAKRLAW